MTKSPLLEFLASLPGSRESTVVDNTSKYYTVECYINGVRVPKRPGIHVQPDDGRRLDVEHIDAVAAGGTIEEINARLRTCVRPARACEVVLLPVVKDGLVQE